ncbi:hypothetical protein G9A89_018888 [Geosiphon pyriformis]|nr:hypothetical protein G9A89_018888 [Geosiphon pyriformis]
MKMVWCEKCRKFGHSALECDAPVVSSFEPSRTFKKIVSDGHHLQLAKLYEKKSVSGILKKLSGIELVPIATPSCVSLPVTPTSLVLHLNVNIAMDDMSLTSAPFLSAVDDVVHNFSSSFSKVLTSKMGRLESKIVVFEVSISLVLEKLDCLCSGNIISVVTETKLKDKVCPWIMNKFDGVQMFTSGLESGYLGANITIIMDASLAKHVCKVFEVSGRLISVKLLFKNKLSVMVLGLYADATLEKRLAYSYVINSIVVEALNGSTFVVLGGDFNKNDFGHSLELLVAKILNAYKLENLERFQALVDKWLNLDFDQAVEFKSFLGNSHDRVLVEQSLAHFRKLYRFHKFLDFKVTENSWIQMAIDKYIKAFVNNKSQMIRSVLEKPFKKVTLDHLVDDKDLVLKPDLVKGRVDLIMEN